MKLQTVVTYIIVIVWIICILAGIIDHTYKIPDTVQIIMSATVSFWFGNTYLNRGNNDKNSSL